MRARCDLVTGALFTLAVSTAHVGAALAQDAATPPPNSLSYDDSGTVEAYQSGLLQIRDSKMQGWLLKIMPDTVVTVEGEAERAYLRPGLTIQIEGEVDKNSALKAPIEAIELVTSQGKPQLGLFPAVGEGEEDPNVRPVRNAGPGKYRIRGKVALAKDDQLVVSIGGRKIAGTLGEKVKIHFTSDDAAMAEMGDTVKAKAWYFDNTRPIPAMNIPGKAVATEIEITLAKPLAPAKRTR